MLIETEPTPNPATLKFLPGRAVMDAGTRDFATPEEAEASPLAEAIFDLGDVTGVFFGRDFISVTAAPGVEWPGLKGGVLAILLDHFSANMPLFRAPSAGFSVPAEDQDFGDDPADAEIVAQIRELIDTRVRPAVANDGGDIVYRGFDKGKVFLQMQGACSRRSRTASSNCSSITSPKSPKSAPSSGAFHERMSHGRTPHRCGARHDVPCRAYL